MREVTFALICGKHRNAILHALAQGLDRCGTRKNEIFDDEAHCGFRQEYQGDEIRRSERQRRVRVESSWREQVAQCLVNDDISELAVAKIRD